MPEVVKQPSLDLLDIKSPGLSSTDDMPKIETKPDVTVPEKDAEAAEVEAEEPATPDKPAPAADDKPKKAQGVQKRIDELTRQREDERRRAEAAEARELRILTALERATVKEQPKPDIEEKEPVRPKKLDFPDPDQYDIAVDDYVTQRAAWIAKREVRSHIEAQERKAAETTAQAQQRAVQEKFKQRVEETSKKYSDYHEVAESPDVQVSFPMAYAILQSEQGPEIQYYLGKNPEEAKRIASMTTTDQSGNSVPDVARQLVELGIITAKLNPVVAKPVSHAPAPGKPIKSGETSTPQTLEELGEKGTVEEYAARRKPELMARRGPGARA